MPEAITQDLVNKFVNSAHCDLGTVQKMLDESPELLNQRSNQDESAIQAAAHTGQKHIVEFLLQKGAPLDVCAAALLGRKEDVQRLLEGNRSQSVATGAHGIPLAFYGALGGDIATVEVLHDHGVDLNAGKDIQTALHASVMANKPEVASWLLAHGARPDIKNYSGQTSLEFAVQLKRTDLLAVLDGAPISL